VSKKKRAEQSRTRKKCNFYDSGNKMATLAQSQESKSAKKKTTTKFFRNATQKKANR